MEVNWSGISNLRRLVTSLDRQILLNEAETNQEEERLQRRLQFAEEYVREIPYLIPPFTCIIRTINKINSEHVPLAVTVVPEWLNQAWYSELKQITLCKINLGKSIEVLIPVSKMKKKGWPLPPENIFLHIVAAKKDEESIFKVQICQLTTQNIQRDSQAIQNHEIDSAIKTQRCTLAILMKLIGQTEEQVHSYLVKQLMKDI
ncbi:MAG: hypothetical protein EZS28_023393 [Streblomastix strix]|uniref:Uncharacterized protein n=1 Tax=Streblomastix strix TaxID=222440 RepID=A0A5J4VER0_9EUKA|nr:MAG: hypothetical protein EZS28_023393 [Streblomastix strix]